MLCILFCKYATVYWLKIAIFGAILLLNKILLAALRCQNILHTGKIVIEIFSSTSAILDHRVGDV